MAYRSFRRTGCDYAIPFRKLKKSAPPFLLAQEGQGLGSRLLGNNTALSFYHKLSKNGRFTMDYSELFGARASIYLRKSRDDLKA